MTYLIKLNICIVYDLYDYKFYMANMALSPLAIN